jgi:hypothetical protein
MRLGDGRKEWSTKSASEYSDSGASSKKSHGERGSQEPIFRNFLVAGGLLPSALLMPNPVPPFT